MNDSIGGLEFSIALDEGKVFCNEADAKIGIWFGLVQFLDVSYVLQFPHK